jgi:hypothetical protein
VETTGVAQGVSGIGETMIEAVLTGYEDVVDEVVGVKVG